MKSVQGCGLVMSAEIGGTVRLAELKDGQTPQDL
jgi:hypothetical protein